MVWAYESQLDEGCDLIVPFADVQKLAESTEDCVDELWCLVGKTQFGISDSSFLFVQCDDKEIEQGIVRRFESVRDIPDITPPPPNLDSPPQAPLG